jgi:hypothetical protein
MSLNDGYLCPVEMNVTSVTDLKHGLRSLIATYSMEAVYTSLTQVMKEDYEFLQKFYAAAPSLETSPATAVAPAVAPTTVLKKKVAKKSSTPLVPSSGAEPSVPSAVAAVALQEEQEAPRIRADTKVRVVKKPTDPQDLPAAPAAVTVAQPSVQPEAQPFVHAESGLRNPQEQKKWQKEQEDKKMRDLRSTGVNPASLLTEANLRKWVEEEKKTFAFIAREYVGLSDGVVAAEAKKYGLQSDTSKRRAMIAANKARA